MLNRNTAATTASHTIASTAELESAIARSSELARVAIYSRVEFAVHSYPKHPASSTAEFSSALAGPALASEPEHTGHRPALDPYSIDSAASVAEPEPSVARLASVAVTRMPDMLSDLGGHNG